MSNKLKAWLAGALIVLAFGIAGSMDHEDALLQQDHYCKMVANGLWPDYNGVYKDECLDLGYPAVPRPFHPDGDTGR